MLCFQITCINDAVATKTKQTMYNFLKAFTKKASIKSRFI